MWEILWGGVIFPWGSVQPNKEAKRAHQTPFDLDKHCLSKTHRQRVSLKEIQCDRTKTSLGNNSCHHIETSRTRIICWKNTIKSKYEQIGESIQSINLAQFASTRFVDAVEESSTFSFGLSLPANAPLRNTHIGVAWKCSFCFHFFFHNLYLPKWFARANAMQLCVALQRTPSQPSSLQPHSLLIASFHTEPSSIRSVDCGSHEIQIYSWNKLLMFLFLTATEHPKSADCCFCRINLWDAAEQRIDEKSHEKFHNKVKDKKNNFNNNSWRMRKKCICWNCSGMTSRLPKHHHHHRRTEKLAISGHFVFRTEKNCTNSIPLQFVARSVYTFGFRPFHSTSKLR